MITPSNKESLLVPITQKPFIAGQKFRESDYLNKISTERINTLFSVLKEKEVDYKSIFNDFDFFSFTDMVSHTENITQITPYSSEVKSFLDIQNNNVVATDLFINYLQEISHNQTFINFQSPERKLNRKMGKYETKPTIIIAGNSGYYKRLEATIFYVHKYFPDFPLIVYDLGLTDLQQKLTILNCKCQVRKFDENKKYSRISPHVLDLQTYAWKPLIIQVSSEQITVFFFGNN